MTARKKAISLRLFAAAVLSAVFMAASPASAHDLHDAYIPDILYATPAASVVYYSTQAQPVIIYRETRVTAPPPRVIYVKARPSRHHDHGHHGHNRGHGHGQRR